MADVLFDPRHLTVRDPCCGSGGMFVQSAKFVESHTGNIRDISIFGQESNPTMWKMAKMNLAIRGIDANFAWMQHMIHYLNEHGRMGMVLANGSLPSQMNNEGDIRKALTRSARACLKRKRASPLS